MDRYFYIRDYKYNDEKTRVQQISGYFTDAYHNNFFPTEDVSREDALKMVKKGIALFLEDGCYRKVYIKVVQVNNQEFLRVDYHERPIDYLG